ncbi:Fibulin-2 [Oryzias melastigma]|uniref:Fibulin-2 n=1 Tax=Oryzias melastigma TaxID=30732 RepID=A0A834EZ33_ORYME|nr:fibulin-2 [Oryzias melastigma]KAF6715081.1 Fibulin-2 [Oryzias melastigma]
MAEVKVTLLRALWFSLCLSVCLCHQDCTGVECPLLDNCIETVLDSGACCASCLQKGCTCEGYQYYDCVSAGFENGSVPEGDSYFVDYGSTECSCPLGGGRIICHFMSCPEVPPNCIEVSEPVDGCRQCQQLGCVHEGYKYEADHSFQVGPCWICHCPIEGGELMCYRKQCDTQNATDGNSSRHDAVPDRFDRHGQMHSFTRLDHLPFPGKLPPFKVPLLDKEDSDDYDYSPTDFSEEYPSLPVPPIQSSVSPTKISSLSHDFVKSDRSSVHPSFPMQGRMELRERHGAHEHPKELTENPSSDEQEISDSHTDSTAAWELLAGAQSVSLGDLEPDTEAESALNKHLGRFIFPLHQGTGSEHHPEFLDVNSESDFQPQGTYINVADSSTPEGSSTETNMDILTRSTETPDSLEKGHMNIVPTIMQKIPDRMIFVQSTTEGPNKSVGLDDKKKVNEDEEEKLEESQSVSEFDGQDVNETVKPFQDKSNEHSGSSGYTRTNGNQPEPSNSSPTSLMHQQTPLPSFVTTPTQAPPGNVEERLPVERWHDAAVTAELEPDAGPGVSAKDLLQRCCDAGHRWASEQFHCKAMPMLTDDEHSICSLAQKQCCISSLNSIWCDSGVTSAKAGGSCERDDEDSCTDDSYQVCCSCCALGLWMRRQGQGCGGYLHLGYSCGHVFLTCCEEDEAQSQLPLKGQEKLTPTVLPNRVSERKFPKEAYSIRTTDEAVNMVEAQQEEDECPLHHRQQCQHKCISAWGSYRCSCFQGYVLQQDGHSCSPVSPEITRVNTEHPPITTGTVKPPTQSTLVDPCAGNGPCSQRCSVVGGQVLCSCFPGFYLMKNGHTCEDIDECLTHKCLPHQRCVNTEGSFTCRAQITCPPGYHLKSSGCQDIDECAMRKDRCGKDFLCENTPGSFKCTPKQKCLSGFTQDAHGNCVDINECSSLAEPCSSGFACINTVGSFSCQQRVVVCNRGYHTSPDGASCVDVDECQMGSHGCEGGQICHNLPGSYRCDCQTGYQFDALRKVCTDVNECWSYPGRLCAQTCENTLGSYLCSCTAGFTLASDQKNCEDINECDQKPCSQECVNMHGSYQCYCRQGYYLKEDGRTCEDIDECSQSIGKLCAFQCVNVVGSYHCACPPHGYVMSANGHTCTDVDECKLGTHNCSFEKSCFNLQGGFRCLSFDCPHNYKKTSSTHCERISCPPNSFDCQNSPLRITYYTLSFQSNILTPAQIFRMGPSPVYPGDHVTISITSGNEENYFSARKLSSFTGAVYIQRKVREPKDFLIEVEMKLLRRGTVSSFLARLYVFFTPSSM